MSASDFDTPHHVTTESGPLFQNCPSCNCDTDVTGQDPLGNAACQHCGKDFVVREQMGPYRLLSVAGRGGMGVVYRAIDTGLDRPVALKVLRKDRMSKVMLTQLETEAMITASINHPHVVKVFTTGSDHGRFYIAMELADKGTLDDLIRLQGRIAEAQVLETAIQVASGLKAAWQAGLIHRDVKPGNILFADAHTAKVVDFGLAMLEREAAEAVGSEIWGTPYYVAPEKLDEQPEDLRSDIYSLGATLFHALAGRPPFEAEDATMVAMKHLKSQAVSLQAFAPWVSGSTAFVINRTLLKNPDERYQNYDELIEHLEYARNELMQQGSGASSKKRVILETEEDQKKWSYVTFGMIGVCILFVGAYFLFGNKKGKQVDEHKTASSSSVGADSRHSSQYDAARQLLIDGKGEMAAQGFRALTQDQSTPSPLLQWCYLHEGLSEFLADHPGEAHEAFEGLDAHPYTATDPAGQKLASFFQKLSALASQNRSIAVAEATEFSRTDYGAFAFFVLGLKDWALGDYDNAGTFFREYSSTLPDGEWVWVSKYKPLASDYVADITDFHGAQTLVSKVKTPADLARVKGELAKIKNEFRRGRRLSYRIDELLSGVSVNGAPASSAPVASATTTTTTTTTTTAPVKRAEEPPREINRAQMQRLDEVRSLVSAKCLTGNYAEALEILKKVGTDDPTGVQDKWSLIQKVKWLSEFQVTLAADVETRGLPVPLKKIDGTEIKGSNGSFTGTVYHTKTGETFEWKSLAPASVFELAKALARAERDPRQAAKRAWLAGVYALLIGHKEDGARLLSGAATLRMEYAEALPTLISGGHESFTRDATATASSTYQDFGARYAVDGDNKTKWCTVQPGTQWLSVDLGKAQTINRWVVRHAHSGPQELKLNAAEFSLQQSKDGNQWTDVDKVTGESSDVTVRSIPSFSSRYLRLLVTKGIQGTEAQNAPINEIGTRIFEFQLDGPQEGAIPDLFAPNFKASVPNFLGKNIGETNVSSSSVDDATGLYTIVAGGSDIAKELDACRYLYRPMAGNGEIVAYVEAIEQVDARSKCGLMFRENLASDSRNVYVRATPGNGVAFQIRKDPHADTTSTTEPSVTLPCWLKLKRDGETFTAFYSYDGFAWTGLGDPLQLPVKGQIYVGVAATSHTNHSTSTQKISQVSIHEE